MDSCDDTYMQKTVKLRHEVTILYARQHPAGPLITSSMQNGGNQKRPSHIWLAGAIARMARAIAGPNMERPEKVPLYLALLWAGEP